MNRIVVVDYALVGDKADQKLRDLLDELGLQSTLATQFSLFDLDDERSAHTPVRGVFGFAIGPSVNSSEIIGKIHNAIHSTLGPRTQMLPALPSKAIRMTISAGGSAAEPEIWNWCAVEERMAK